MGFLKKKKQPQEEPLPPLPPQEQPLVSLDLSIDAEVQSTIRDENGLRSFHMVSFKAGEYDSALLDRLLATIDKCMNDDGTVRVGFFPRKEVQQDGEGSHDNTGK